MLHLRRFSMTLFLGCLLFLNLGNGNVADAAEPVLQAIQFQPSTVDFTNPERGFLHFRDLTNSFGYNNVRSEGHSLIYGRILASNFRNAPFSQAFLNQIQAGFDAARTNGIKVKPRVQYNSDGGADAPKAIILNHIQQLKPLWEANKDVIYHMDAGFIGGWGEWHSSTNGLDNNADRTEILNAILDALPEDRMVGIRTPHFKREIFNGSPTDATQKITASNAFDGSNLSRVGHLNDCFLASSSDFGTYIYQGSGWSRQNEIDYIGGESRYSPHGGETCNQSILSSGPSAISEMTQLHTDYMNIDYHPDVVQAWKDSNDFETISKGLGYRYELQSASLPDAVKPSGILEIQFDLDNVGFGELFNPRNVEVTLKNNTSGEISSAPLQVDPRFWSGGSSNQVQALLSIPADMETGTYTVGLKMPDIEASLNEDVRYSIRFANAGVWDDATGINILKTDLQISDTADGVRYDVSSEFEAIADRNELNLLADFDLDSDVDGHDFLAWQRGFGTQYDATDLANWQIDYGPVASALSTLNPVPEPSSLMLVGLAMLGLQFRFACSR